MSDVRDWSTRKLKRNFWKTYKKVWSNQVYDLDLSGVGARKTLRQIRQELEHRGWTV